MDTIDLLSDVDKWQACSHPDLTNRQPEELFEPAFVEPYRRLQDDLWHRIIRLHGTIYTLEQLELFPFDYLYGLNGMEFWRLVVESFLDTAVLMLHSLVNDTAKDAHTLMSFKNDVICAPWLHQKELDLLKCTLQERKFDGAVRAVAKRVDTLRDHWVAHRLIDRDTGSPKQGLAGVSLEEFRRLFDAAHNRFGALSFGSSYATLAGDLTPATVGGKPTRSCLDKVLDAVLRDSEFVNGPERRAPWWPEERKYRNPEELRVMNELRKRIGLPEA